MNEIARPQAARVAERVLTALRPRSRPGDRVVILAGAQYREHLTPALCEWGCQVEVPLAGMRIGEQKRWLKSPAPGHPD